MRSSIPVREVVGRVGRCEQQCPVSALRSKGGDCRAVLWFTCARPKSSLPDRLRKGRERRWLHPLGPAPGISCTLWLRHRAGLSDPSSAWWAIRTRGCGDGPRPASSIWAASLL